MKNARSAWRRGADDHGLPSAAAGWYSKSALWRMLSGSARWAGEKLVKQSLALYFCLRDSDTPMWAKSTIVAALGYLIMPVDAIPDLLPMIGLSDDIGAIGAAVAAVMRHLKPEHHRRAEQCWLSWSRQPKADQPPVTEPVKPGRASDITKRMDVVIDESR